MMLTGYIRAALHRVHYEILSDEGSFYGEIPDFDGVYANAATKYAKENAKFRLHEPVGGVVKNFSRNEFAFNFEHTRAQAFLVNRVDAPIAEDFASGDDGR